MMLWATIQSEEQKEIQLPLQGDLLVYMNTWTLEIQSLNAVFVAA